MHAGLTPQPNVTSAFTNSTNQPEIGLRDFSPGTSHSAFDISNHKTNTWITCAEVWSVYISRTVPFALTEKRPRRTNIFFVMNFCFQNLFPFFLLLRKIFLKDLPRIKMLLLDADIGKVFSILIVLGCRSLLNRRVLSFCFLIKSLSWNKLFYGFRTPFLRILDVKKWFQKVLSARRNASWKNLAVFSQSCEKICLSGTRSMNFFGTNAIL